MRLSLFVEFALFLTSLAAPSPASQPPPQPTFCGDIVNSGASVFTAKLVFDCLTSVPFNPAIASRFLKYYNDTLAFQSTVAYLKTPPASYQQPATDLFGGLNRIQRQIDNGGFPNQYAFEATLQSLVYSAHESHMTLTASILAPFVFASPYSLVSVSKDGLDIPKIYITDDIIENPFNRTSWQPSAVSKINGGSAVDYLAQLAALNAIGGLEPNADWNQLMSSPALDIQGFDSIMEGYVTFYPGENITFTLENGTVLGPDPWYAIYTSPGLTGPLSTGGDFFNFFALGFFPASFDPNATSTTTEEPSASFTQSAVLSTSTTTPLATPFPHPAFPAPVVLQPDLGSGGWVSGYFLNDLSLAVLSIPSFQAFGDSVAEFSDTVEEFLRKSQAAGMKKILIDLQQNSGGDTFLAIDTFKQFFPAIDPFGGSRLRAHPAADVIGNTFSQLYSHLATNGSIYDAFSTSEWVALDILNAATDQNFTNWGEFFGPHPSNGDQFTTKQRYNLSSGVFDLIASGGIVVHGFGNRTFASLAPPFASQDIVILTDGLCASACAMFMEMMHHEGGVRSVVAGGRPSTGPMQAPAGTRGATFYNSFAIDIDIAVAIAVNSTTAKFLPERSENVVILAAGINLRDQVRRDSDIPLQFTYEAADCRIFYTPQTVYNFANLWRYAANAIWTKPELCVKGSTGYASSTATNVQGPPAGSVTVPKVSHNVSAVYPLGKATVSLPSGGVGGQKLDQTRNNRSVIGQTCNSSRECVSGGLICEPSSPCGVRRCVESCSSRISPCGPSCIFTSTTSYVKTGSHTSKSRSGFCPLNCNTVSNPSSSQATNVPPPPAKQADGSRTGGAGTLGGLILALFTP